VVSYTGFKTRHARRLHPIYLNVQTNLLKTWNFATGNSVSSIHPPQEDIQIYLKDGPILATLLRKGREGNDTVKFDNFKKVY